jgi:transposase-like protein
LSKRRQYSVNEKLEHILLCLRNPGKESQICRERGIHPSVYARWKKKFLEAGREGLKHGATSGDAREKEIKDLKELLAQLYVENQFLKKTIRVGK